MFTLYIILKISIRNSQIFIKNISKELRFLYYFFLLIEALDIAKKIINLYNYCIFEIVKHQIYVY